MSNLENYDGIKRSITMNEYEPWKELGIDECAYFKMRYVQARQEIERLREVIERATRVDSVTDYLNRKRIKHGSITQVLYDELSESKKRLP